MGIDSHHETKRLERSQLAIGNLRVSGPCRSPRPVRCDAGFVSRVKQFVAVRGSGLLHL